MGMDILAQLTFERPVNEVEIRKHVPVSALGVFGDHSWEFEFTGSSFVGEFTKGLPGLVKAVGPIEGTVEINGWRLRVSRTGLLPGWTSKKYITWAVCPGCGTKVSGKKVCLSCEWEKGLARQNEWDQKLTELGSEKLLELQGECKCRRGNTLRIPCQCGELHCHGCYTGSLRWDGLCKYTIVTEKKLERPSLSRPSKPVMRGI